MFFAELGQTGAGSWTASPRTGKSRNTLCLGRRGSSLADCGHWLSDPISTCSPLLTTVTCACVCPGRSPRVGDLPVHRYVEPFAPSWPKHSLPCALHVACYPSAFLLLQAHLWALGRSFCPCLGNRNSPVPQQGFREANSSGYLESVLKTRFLFVNNQGFMLFFF